MPILARDGLVKLSFQPNHLRCQRGFTLTEIAIVLGVVGVILSGIWLAYSEMAANNRINETMKQITSIVSSMRTAFSASRQFSAAITNDLDITPQMVRMRVFPTSTANPVNADQPLTPFGTVYTLLGRAQNNPRWFALDLNLNLGGLGNAQQICETLMAKIAPAGNGFSPVRIVVAGVVIDPLAAGFDPLAAFNGCTNGVLVYSLE